jgi:hypothetical protein
MGWQAWPALKIGRRFSRVLLHHTTIPADFPPDNDIRWKDIRLLAADSHLRISRFIFIP